MLWFIILNYATRLSLSFSHKTSASSVYSPRRERLALSLAARARGRKRESSRGVYLPEEIIRKRFHISPHDEVKFKHERVRKRREKARKNLWLDFNWLRRLPTLNSLCMRWDATIFNSFSLFKFSRAPRGRRRRRRLRSCLMKTLSCTLKKRLRRNLWL